MPLKTILITGCGAGGIGAALAKALHLRGHRVLATGRTPDEIDPSLPHGIASFPLDVTSDTSIRDSVVRVRQVTGGDGLDILINTAGLVQVMPFADTRLDDFKRLMDVNVTGTWAVSHAFLPLLLDAKNGGTIVGLGSINEVLCPPFFAAYNATKAAVEAMMRSMRRELAPLGIKVVLLKTGSVGSHLFQNAISPTLPEGSLYTPLATYFNNQEFKQGTPFMDVDEYAEKVTREILGDAPRAVVWFGGLVWISWILSWLGWETMMVSASFISILPDCTMAYSDMI